jgi:hypothetical protein
VSIGIWPTANRLRRRFNALFVSRRTKRAQFTRNSMSNSFGHQCFRAENDCWYRHKEGTGARHPQRRPAYGLLLLRFPLVLWVVSRFVERQSSQSRSIFFCRLSRERKKAELSRNDDPAALAHFFVITVQGMRGMARLKSDKRALEQVARIALAVFNSSHPRHEKN